jgi:hypothetical protein
MLPKLQIPRKKRKVGGFWGPRITPPSWIQNWQISFQVLPFHVHIVITPRSITIVAIGAVESSKFQRAFGLAKLVRYGVQPKLICSLWAGITINHLSWMVVLYFSTSVFKIQALTVPRNNTIVYLVSVHSKFLARYTGNDFNFASQNHAQSSVLYGRFILQYTLFNLQQMAMRRSSTIVAIRGVEIWFLASYQKSRPDFLTATHRQHWLCSALTASGCSSESSGYTFAHDSGVWSPEIVIKSSIWGRFRSNFQPKWPLSFQRWSRPTMDHR